MSDYQAWKPQTPDERLAWLKEQQAKLNIKPDTGAVPAGAETAPIAVKIPQPDSRGEFASPLDGALYMASLGIPQTPLKAGTKEAFLPEWQEKSSIDPEQIKAWAREYPNCNFGSVAKGHIFMFEADSTAVRERFKSTGEDFTSEFIVESSKGKGHRYYLWVVGVENVSQKDGKDFSVRVSNQYCVTAGSLHPDTGKQYRIVKNGVIKEPSAAEIAFWAAVKNVKTERPADKAEPADKPVASKVTQGSRNDYLASCAGKLRNARAEEEEILSALLRINESDCEPPLEEDEVKNIAHSYGKYAEGGGALLIGGKLAGAGAAVDDEHDDCPYRIVGADKEPSGDVLLVFPTIEESELAQRLGFNAVAIVNGNNGVFEPSITMLKMKYDHLAVFGKTEATAFLSSKIGQGATPVEYPPDLSKPKREGRKTFPRFSSLVTAADSDSEFSVQTYLDLVTKMDAVTGTSNTIQRTAQEVKDKIRQTLDNAKTFIPFAEPKIVIARAISDLRALEIYDDSLPKPLTEVSLHGILGDFIKLAHPKTVSNKEMILFTMLPMIGALMGDAYYRPFGENKHFPSFFTLNIARTADGKGQTQDLCEAAIAAVDADWKKSGFHDVPASGEGLIRLLSKSVVFGGRRRRAVFAIPEMSTAFNNRAREYSNLKSTMLKMYDGARLENERSSARQSKTADYYMAGVAGFITPMVLRSVMPNIDWHDGTGNRQLWNIGGRDKRLRTADQPDFTDWAARVTKLYKLNGYEPNKPPTGDSRPIEYSKAGQTCWNEWFDSLPDDGEGALFESQRRQPANCARLANLYAQLDERRLDGWQPVLEPVHINAAIEILARSAQSVEWYLGQQNTEQSSGANYADVMKLKQAMLAKMTKPAR